MLSGMCIKNTWDYLFQNTEIVNKKHFHDPQHQTTSALVVKKNKRKDKQIESAALGVKCGNEFRV